MWLGLGSGAGGREHSLHMLRGFDPGVQPEEGRKKHVFNADAACLQFAGGVELECMRGEGRECRHSAYCKRVTTRSQAAKKKSRVRSEARDSAASNAMARIPGT